MLWTLLAVIGALALFALAVIALYNKLVKYRVGTENAWSQIDVQLKRRCDLIPNLVETVKGVMQFERETLTQVMQARANAMSAGSALPERLKAEGEISGLIGRLLAVWENYPQLKSNQNAIQLQEELTTTENRIAYASAHYNDMTANYNTLAEQFPSNLLAKTFGFSKKEFFKISESQKTAPTVKL